MLAGNFLYCQPAFSRLAAKARNRHPALWKCKLDRSFESQRRIQADMGINNQCFGCHFLRLLLHGYSLNTSVMRIAAGYLGPFGVLGAASIPRKRFQLGCGLPWQVERSRLRPRSVQVM